jgi:alanine dehydrogenase
MSAGSTGEMMLQLDAVALAACLDRETLIDALDDAFRKPYSVPTRQQYQLQPTTKGQSGGTLLVMPAWNTGGGLGVKIVTVFPDNALRSLPAVCASYLLLDATNGRPRAILDGGELTLRRTGAASALASRHLSSPDSSRLLMVGTGELAPHLIASHALVRPIREVRIWGRHAGRARALAASLTKADLSVESTEDLETATGWADIVSCATLSKQPLVLGAWLRPGQHLDLVGAFTPEMREVDDDAIARSELYVDTRAGALGESGEIIGAMARGIIDQTAVRGDFSDLAAGLFKRSAPHAITIFKSVGTALEDLVAAELALGASQTRAERERGSAW